MTPFGPQEREKFFQSGAKCFLGVFFDARSKKITPEVIRDRVKERKGVWKSPKSTQFDPP